VIKKAISSNRDLTRSNNIVYYIYYITVLYITV